MPHLLNGPRALYWLLSRASVTDYGHRWREMVISLSSPTHRRSQSLGLHHSDCIPCIIDHLSTIYGSLGFLSMLSTCVGGLLMKIMLLLIYPCNFLHPPSPTCCLHLLILPQDLLYTLLPVVDLICSSFSSPDYLAVNPLMTHLGYDHDCENWEYRVSGILASVDCAPTLFL
ncbi:hypothetical protein GYMLUDRAFT_896693 [Collybiopsis luxurians FD-317 M1]|uniref:Uncharacterized protein n=1 Tax=Collybiopsis luxurians FD-317 M1 TaxID=944289 RepID=A0A0D0BIL5_9AGAR|nr:hypothetical protein GYMLUDRAFT_896693 [Collybiopsis luxurians FD-317 M1]